MSFIFSNIDFRVRYADTGEPSAEERAWLVCPMTEVERREFGERIERIADQYRAMTPADIERVVDELAGEAGTDPAPEETT